MKKFGFTLIELLVVIFIIGLLASIVTVNVNVARQKGRDAKRSSDLDTIRTAVELYNNTNKTYPTTIDQLVSGGYLQTTPKDPVNTGLYIYVYSSNGTDYKIAANRMESQEGIDKAKNDNGTKNTCSTSTSNDCAYELFSANGRTLF